MPSTSQPRELWSLSTLATMAGLKVPSRKVPAMSTENWREVRRAWPGFPGSVRCEQKTLPGGVLVAVHREASYRFHWLVYRGGHCLCGVADSRRLAIRAALFAETP